MIRVTAFRWVPPFAQGLSRDLRLRWALEEAGLPYEVRQIGPEDQTTESYRKLQPFGQVPVYEEDGLVLFESGAILHHIAGKAEVLMPPDPAGRARVTAWLFAAMNTLEPVILNLAGMDIFYQGEEWARLRRPAAAEIVMRRLSALSESINGRDFLEDRFSVADVLMTTVLDILRHTDLVSQFPALDGYLRRCHGRPAYERALADHLAGFAGNAPGG